MYTFFNGVYQLFTSAKYLILYSKFDLSWIRKNSRYGYLHSEFEFQEDGGEPKFGGAVKDFTNYMKKNAPKYDHIGYDFAISITG